CVTADVNVEATLHVRRSRATAATPITSAALTDLPQDAVDSPSSSLQASSAAGVRRKRSWATRYARRLRVSDLIVLAAVVYSAQLVWFGLGNAEVAMSADHRLNDLSYWTF